MTSVLLRSVELGAGAPKICVPVMGATLAELAAHTAQVAPHTTATPFILPIAPQLASKPATVDLVELRIDTLAGSATNPELVAEAIRVVRAALPDTVPLLFTFRTTREGGTQPITDGDYAAVLATAIGSGEVDAVDLEMRTTRDLLEAIVSAARAYKVAVVMSNHDFEQTPAKAEIIARLREQQDLGADVTKIAVMPRSPRDVITLLDATEEFTATFADRPTITMAMGPDGVISRLAGEIFGSTLSFGQVGAASAPGQVDASELRRVLDLLHRAG
ncbi:MAG: type 3-dehydroquinate dehydratase [Glaciihabitans sp.]|nr:type 3-dehydroquinate dehydratase [Glaciihabitans sp.]